MPDLSLLLACTQCSNVSSKPAQHCQEIRNDEITPAKSDIGDCVSQPESMELAFSPPVNQETSQKDGQKVAQGQSENRHNHQNYVAAGEYRPLSLEMLLPTGGFLFLFAVGGIFLIAKRFPEAQRQWQLLLQGDAGIFGSGLTLPKEKEEFDQPVILQQSRAWSHAIVWSIVGVTTFAVVWASTAKIDESVPVQGKLEPKGFVKDIQAPVGGVIDQIHVQEGQRVKKGDLLVSFDRTTTQAKLKSLEAVRASLMAENQFYQMQMRSSETLPKASPITNSNTAQLKELPELAALTENRSALIQENQLFRAELNQSSGIRDLNPRSRQRLLTRQLERETRIESVRLDREQLTRQLNQVQAQIINARGSLTTNLEIANNLETLVQKGAFARLPYLERRQAADASQAEVNRLVQEQERLKLAIAQGQKKLENAIALSKEDLLSKIADNEKRIADIDSQLTKVIIENKKKIQEINSEISELQVNMKYQELRAANDGIIFDLKPRSSGYVYNSSETILKIVPPENLVAQVYITNNDIGFVKAGMPVDVRIDSFPYTEFSDIKGQLVRIGSDALPPDQTHPYYRFAAEIRLDKQSLNVNGTEVPLQSGMSLNANINLRKRTVMSIFTDKFLGKVESLKYTR
ncbi:HlyD family efflux transporter periplasmic adaptor subunit [Tolypothrix sp. FACHB-123]|uniref:HlyD family efflux transporter periplasmic adaptor subunit n=1 Tax=Tolypothrix sp. FACHB-123 TaxID=2692868 RepID=UPI00168314DB|nr:HlyD family efflux transporter periplasmic adaptor subunit [Tolypothrix sp. FACHB-123]MBD2353098.1 HlyD family efflux transporter periplasmic adaptor subunit [Tolypothrix sp. FACHB-123]